MDEVANKILQIFIRLVRKEMDEYEEDENKRCELYHRIKNNLRDKPIDSNNYASEVRIFGLGGIHNE